MKSSKHSKHKNTLRKPISRNKEPWYLSKSFFSSSFPYSQQFSRNIKNVRSQLSDSFSPLFPVSPICAQVFSFTKQPDANVTVYPSSLFLLPYIPKTNNTVLSCFIRRHSPLLPALGSLLQRTKSLFCRHWRVTLLCVGLLGVRKFWKERERILKIWECVGD